jgi:hypothetical protein
VIKVSGVAELHRPLRTLSVVNLVLRFSKISEALLAQTKGWEF